MACPFPLSASLALPGSLPLPRGPPRALPHPFPWPSSWHWCYSVCWFITPAAFYPVRSASFRLGNQLWLWASQLRLFSRGKQPCLPSLCTPQMRPSGVVMLTAARNTWTTALKHLQPIYSTLVTLKPLGSVLLKLLVHMDHLRVLLKRRFCFSRSGAWDPAFLITFQVTAILLVQDHTGAASL